MSTEVVLQQDEGLCPLLLPEILNAVFNFLGDAELECGLLVCRAWRRALATRVWRHVAVLGRGAPQPPLSEESPSRTAPQSRANKCVYIIVPFRGNNQCSRLPPQQSVSQSAPSSDASAPVNPPIDVPPALQHIPGLRTATSLVLDAARENPHITPSMEPCSPAAALGQALAGLAALGTAGGQAPRPAAASPYTPADLAATLALIAGCTRQADELKGSCAGSVLAGVESLVLRGPWVLPQGPSGLGPLAGPWLPSLTRLVITANPDTPGVETSTESSLWEVDCGISRSSSSCTGQQDTGGFAELLAAARQPCCGGFPWPTDTSTAGTALGANGGRHPWSTFIRAAFCVNLSALWALVGGLPSLQLLCIPLLIADKDPITGPTGWAAALSALSTLSGLTSLHLHPGGGGSPLCLVPELAGAVRSWAVGLPGLRCLGLGLAECCHAHPDMEGAMWEDPEEWTAGSSWRGVFQELKQLSSLQLTLERITDELWGEVVGGCMQLQSLALHQTAWGGAFEAHGLARLRGCRQLALTLGDCATLPELSQLPLLTDLQLDLIGMDYTPEIAVADAANAAPAAYLCPNSEATAPSATQLFLPRPPHGPLRLLAGYGGGGPRPLRRLVLSCRSAAVQLHELQHLCDTCPALEVLVLRAPLSGSTISTSASTDSDLDTAPAHGWPPLNSQGCGNGVLHGPLRLPRDLHVLMVHHRRTDRQQHVPLHCSQPSYGQSAWGGAAGRGAGAGARAGAGGAAAVPQLVLAPLPSSLRSLSLHHLVVCVEALEGGARKEAGEPPGGGAVEQGLASCASGAAGLGRAGGCGLAAGPTLGASAHCGALRVDLVGCTLLCGLGQLCGSAVRHVRVSDCVGSARPFSKTTRASSTSHTRGSRALLPESDGGDDLWSCGEAGTDHQHHGTCGLLGPPRRSMLRTLWLWGCRGADWSPLTDASLAGLTVNLPYLTALAVNAGAATPDGLSALGRLVRLVTLWVAVGSQQCAAALAEHLAALPLLREVCVAVPHGSSQLVAVGTRDHLAARLPGAAVRLQFL